MKTTNSVYASVQKVSLIKLFLFPLFALITTLSYSQTTITSTAAGGPWNSASTWVGGVVPTQGANNNVVIASGATVTVPSSVSCVNLTVNGNLTMTGSNIKLSIGNPGSNTGSLTLGSGSNLFIGSTNTVEFVATQTGPGITNNGGTIASTGTNGSDGGTIQIDANSGAGFFVGGTAGTTVNNFKFIQNASFNISGPSLLVNGTFTIPNNNWNWAGGSKSPIYGPASTLYIDRGNQGYSQGTEWTANSGTIGVTPGYPNNVVLVNMGSSVFNGTGWHPTGAVGLNGALHIGDGTTNGRITLEDVTSFTSGGIIVDDNSLIIGPKTGVSFIDKGDFILTGATTGIFQSSGATINFAGSGTTSTPQVISTTGSSVQFTNVTVTNGTYVKLQDPVSITGNLNLSSGYIGTTSTNLLTVNNTSTTAVTGGSTTAYVDGPLAWSIPATTSSNYVFPIGDRTHNGGSYLPLTLSPNSTSGATVTATAFNMNSGGTPDATVTTLSNTEYWSLSTSTPFSSGPLVSVTRQTAVSPNNALATSSTSNGIYSAIGGTPSGNTISGGGVGTTSPVFIAMAVAPLSVVKLSGTNVTCNGTTGSLTVGGSGGTAPYTYSIDGGAYQASNTFSPLTHGDHIVRVKDNTGAVALATLKVLGSLVINGNGKDVDICVGQSTTLTANNLLNSTPTYSWSTSSSGTPVIGNSASITVSPVVATTYYVTSDLYINNLFTNGSFESGNSGFTSSYSYYTGAQYATTPGNNGYYSISNAGINQCQYFSTTGVANQPSLSPQDGGLYFIGDGATASSMVWSETVSGLSVGTVYKFQFYYAAGDPDATRAVLRPTINGGSSLGDITTTNSTAWTLASFSWTATSTSATVTITNMTATGSTNGNDFFLDNMQFLAPCTVTESINVTTNCTLPIVMVDFTVAKHDQGAILNWETATEINSSYYIIERSRDGKTFDAIGKVNAVGNSHNLVEYSYVDPTIEACITYYRIVEYDKDGSSSYSEVKAIVQSGGLSDFVIVPNPSNGIFVIILDHDYMDSYDVTITNSIGQIILEDKGLTSSINKIDISSFATGIYYLQIHLNDSVTIKKIIKE
jgi:hypothetical protein